MGSVGVPLLVGLVLVLAGLALLLVGALGATGRLPRNRYAGLRTAAALRSAQSFRVGNRVAGPLVAAAGAVAIIGGTALLLAESGAVLVTIGALTGLGTLGLVAAAGVLGDRAAAAVAPETAGAAPACMTACAGCDTLSCLR